MYVVIYNAFVEEIKPRRENPVGFVLWWRSIKYLYLLDLYGKAILITGGVLEYKDSYIKYALCYFIN